MDTIIETGTTFLNVLQNLVRILIVVYGSWQMILQVIKLNKTYDDYGKNKIYKKIIGQLVFIIISLIIVSFIFSLIIK